MAVTIIRKMRFQLPGLVKRKIVEKQAEDWAKEYGASVVTIIRDNGTPNPNDENWIIELELA